MDVQDKMGHLNTAEKNLLQDIKDKEEEDTEDIKDANKELATEIETEQQQQQQTHNRIF